MVAHLHCATFFGIEAMPVEVEVDVARASLAATSVVGLPDAAVKESIERVRAAMYNSGYSYPRYKTVINLAPADLRKEGPAFDLPIALGILLANGDVQSDLAGNYLMTGELALDGRVRPTRGTLSSALLAHRSGLRGIIVATENAPEAAVVADLEVIPVSSLAQAVGFLSGQLPVEPVRLDVNAIFNQAAVYPVDFADVRGQETAKRALTIAAAGSHNALLIGPPGSGKTMLAKRIPTILPPLTLAESLETTRIHSVAGELKPGVPLLATRPVRSPHHSASTPALVGGGTTPQAGEVSLAHFGVLFLDEFPEFSRSALEALRQPLEDGDVTIARAALTVTFPARFLLVAAMNPCPCGYLGDSRRACRCSPMLIEKYLARVSGPLIDRVDIHVEVPAVPYDELRGRRDGTPSSTIRDAVFRAREKQLQRFGDPTMTNSRMSGRLLRDHCMLDARCEALLRQAIAELGLSARAHDKVLRIARTIADIADHSSILPEDLMEAIHYRRLDRKM